MRTLVASLKRLYEKGKLTIDQIADRVDRGSISNEEFTTITGKVYETDV